MTGIKNETIQHFSLEEKWAVSPACGGDVNFNLKRNRETKRVREAGWRRDTL